MAVCAEICNFGQTHTGNSFQVVVGSWCTVMHDGNGNMVMVWSMVDMDGSSSLIYAILAMSHLHIEASNSYSRLELSNWVAMVPSLIDGMASPTRYHTSTTIVHIPSSFSTVLTDHAVTR